MLRVVRWIVWLELARRLGATAWIFPIPRGVLGAVEGACGFIVGGNAIKVTTLDTGELLLLFGFCCCSGQSFEPVNDPSTNGLGYFTFAVNTEGVSEAERYRTRWGNAHHKV